MTEPDSPQPLTLIEALIPVASLILLIGLSYHLFGDAGASGPNQVALVVATMIAVFIAWRRGHTMEALGKAASDGVSAGIGAIFILLAVGALIGAWALSGTLVAMVYYGLQLLNPDYFYATAAVICAVISISIGSSWTVVGTIGIGLMGISLDMGLNPAITAAAVISGAYFGDTISPLSDSANLAAAAAGVNLYHHLRATAVTSLLALLVALVVFWLLGQRGDPAGADHEMAAIYGTFHISLVLFLPLVLVIVLALLRLPPFSTIFIGALVGGVLAVLVAPDRVAAFVDAAGAMPRWLALVKAVWLAIASGYVLTTGDPALDHLVSRGGMASMLNTIWLVIAALAFGGVVERAGVLDRLMAPIIAAATSVGGLVTALVGAVIVTNVVAADQYIAIVLPGRMFKGAFAKREIPPVVLSRTVGASGTPTSALVPWNSCGAYMAATLGVATFSYLPYAVFSFISPVLAIAFAYAGFQIRRGPGTAEQPIAN
jgi:NhaC family Na+:H+ antiporter